MNKIFFIFFPTILICQVGFTQIEWVKSIGGEGLDRPIDIIIDDANHIYLAASFQNSINVDPSSSDQVLNASLASESFVLKLDDLGNFLSVSHLTEEREGLSISIDSENNVYYLYSTDEWSEFRLEKRNQQGEIVNERNVFGLGISSFQLPKKMTPELVPIQNTFCIGESDDVVSLYNDQLNCIGDNYSLTEPEWMGFVAFGNSNFANGLYHFAVEVNGTVRLQWGDNIIEIGETDFFNDTFWKTTSYILSIDINGNLVEVNKINEGGMQDPSQTNFNLAWNIEADTEGNFYVQNLFWGNYTFGVGSSEKLITSVGGPGVFNSVIQKVDKSNEVVTSYWLGDEANFTDFAVDENNNLILSGIYASSVDLVLDGASSIVLMNENSVNNSFVVKYNNEFEYIDHIEFKDLDVLTIKERNDRNFFYGQYNTETLIIGDQEFVNNGESDLVFGEFDFSESTYIQDLGADNFSVFPIPFQDYVEIKELDEIIDVEIFDVFGNLQNSIFNKTTSALDTRQLTNGCYILVVRTGKSILSKLIIKNAN